MISPELNQAWKRLKQTGTGYVELFQETELHLGQNQPSFQISSVPGYGSPYESGSEVYFNKFVGRKVYTPLLLLHRSEVFRNLDTLLFYGKGLHRDESGRWNYALFHVCGDLPDLRQTYEAIKNNPKNIDEFMNQVFLWNSVPFSRVEPELPKPMSEQQQKLEKEERLRYYKWRMPNPDLTELLENLTCLDLSEGFGFGDRLITRVTGRNPKNVLVKVK
ncbi:MAG: hypothetical protein WCV90_04950 [Candidatus Woesearchaeota archaeon]|jgi:hypothetical protein